MIKFPNFYQLTIGIVLLSNSLFFSSCHDKKKDPEPVVVDSTKPTVSITSPAANEVLKGTKTIKVEASDDKAVTKVVFFLDNVRLDSLLATPYNFEWNTTIVNDGVHTIKILATDDTGNNEAAEVSVTVKNKDVLLTYDVPSNALGNNGGDVSKIWIILHDKEWNIITWGELRSGETLELTAPNNFTGNDFTMTQILLLQEAGKPYISASSMLQYPKGSHLSMTQIKNDDSEGFANLSFTNATSDFYQVSTNGGLYSFYNYEYNGYTDVYGLNTGERSIYLTKSPSRLYIHQKFETGNKFYMTNTVLNKDATYSQDLNDVNNADASNILKKETFDVAPGRDFFYVTLFGLTSTGNFKEGYHLGQFQKYENTITLEYPKDETNTFAQYFSITEYSTDKYDVSNAGFGKYNSEPLNATGSFKDLKLTTASVTTSGEFDLFSATFYTEDNDIENDFITIIGPAISNQKLKLPTIPTSIIEQLPFVDFAAYQLAPVLDFVDYNSVANYSDLLLKLNESIFDNYMEVRTLKLNVVESSTTGRKESKLKREIRPNRFGLWASK